MIVRHQFDDSLSLADALSDAVAERLRDGIAARGMASLAVSGGSTPKRFFAVLGARADIEWSKVIITLVDERWVDESSDRSNARLVNLTLRAGPAAASVFLPLFAGGNTPTNEALALTNARLLQLPERFDAVVLGMGTDGHTASFFPGGDTLGEALRLEGPAIAIHAPGAGEARVTLTLPRLLRTEALFLHIEGDAKLKTLEEAQKNGPVEDMPVRAVLRQDQRQLDIFWCP